MKKSIGIVLCLAGLMTSCYSSILTPTNTVPPVPTSEPTVTNTIQLAMTGKPSPTATPTVQMVDLKLSASGPWMVFTALLPGADLPQLFVLDAATHEIQAITSTETTLYWSFLAQQPVNGTQIVFATGRERDIWLNMLTLPEGRITPLVNVLPSNLALASDAYMELDNALNNSLDAAWNNNRLAFIGGLDGPTPDVYLWEDGDVQRLTHEPTRVRGLYWSPDGRYLAYGVKDYFGEDVCYGHKAIRAIDLLRGTIQTLTPPETIEAQLIGWYDEDTAIIITRPDESCQWATLYRVNVSTGDAQTWWGEPFTAAAYDPASDTALLTQGGSQFYARTNPEYEQPAGVILVTHDNWQSFNLQVYDSVRWAETVMQFLLRSDTDLIGINPSAQVNDYPAPDGYAGFQTSPDGRWILWTPLDHYEISAWGQEPTMVADQGIWAASWSPDSAGLYFWIEQTLYYAQAPDFESEPLQHIQLDGFLHWIMP